MSVLQSSHVAIIGGIEISLPLFSGKKESVSSWNKLLEQLGEHKGGKVLASGSKTLDEYQAA